MRKRLMQTWVNFEQDVIDAAIDQWRDRLRSWGVLVADTLNTCSEMSVHLHDSSEHFMKLSM